MVDGGDRLEMVQTEKYHRRRRRRWHDRLPPWVKDYAVELGMGAAVLIAIFLLVEPWNLRETLFRWLNLAVDWVSTSVWSLGTRLVNRLTLSDATALVILLGVVILAGARVRWRVVRNPNLWNTHCPRCQSTELRRVHRRWIDRLVGRLGFPVRRYTCRQCEWSGARIARRGGH